MSKRGASGTRFVFRLYIAGDAPHSAQAVANFKLICEKYLQDCHQVEVIDVLKDPLSASFATHIRDTDYTGVA